MQQEKNTIIMLNENYLSSLEKKAQLSTNIRDMSSETQMNNPQLKQMPEELKIDKRLSLQLSKFKYFHSSNQINSLKSQQIISSFLQMAIILLYPFSYVCIEKAQLSLIFSYKIIVVLGFSSIGLLYTIRAIYLNFTQNNITKRSFIHLLLCLSFIYVSGLFSIYGRIWVILLILWIAASCTHLLISDDLFLHKLFIQSGGQNIICFQTLTSIYSCLCYDLVQYLIIFAITYYLKFFYFNFSQEMLEFGEVVIYVFWLTIRVLFNHETLRLNKILFKGNKLIRFFFWFSLYFILLGIFFFTNIRLPYEDSWALSVQIITITLLKLTEVYRNKDMKQKYFFVYQISRTLLTQNKNIKNKMTQKYLDLCVGCLSEQSRFCYQGCYHACCGYNCIINWLKNAKQECPLCRKKSNLMVEIKKVEDGKYQVIEMYKIGSPHL